jgi:ferrous iron transport protein B
MQTFDWSFSEAASADTSILASIARPFAYLLVPIVGVLSWQLAAAAVTGFIAKENVVGTLAVCFVGLENLIDTEELSLMEGAGAEVAGCAIAVEKAFQQGGKRVRELGVRVESLARVESMSDDSLTFVK